jgi:spermidine/putrescine transport system substrate-binding protein
MTINRRIILKGALASAAALAAPAILRARDALASSGSLNVFAWGDYFDKNTIPADFEKVTGIKVNLSTYGSNEELENKLRAAAGKGFDVVFPSVDTGPSYYKDNLLQPIDEKRVKVEQVNPSIYRNSLTLGSAYRGKRYTIPFDWGTEAITWDSSVIAKDPKDLSYGDLWAVGLTKKVAVRQKSVLVSIALYLDAIGQVKSSRALDLYKDEENCKRVFDAALKFAVEHKQNIGAYWNNATEATAAFKDAGCVIGQTWDTTGILLNRSVDKKFRYGMPKEGGEAWTDTLAIPSGAENVEQAYAFINYLYSPQVGAAFANGSGYNTCAVGAEAFLSPEAKAAFEMAYPAGAIDNLWWWPMMPPFVSKLRGEYAEKLTNA